MAINDIIVATYNIRHGVNMAGDLDLDATAALLAQINPHIIALQEVDELRPRSNWVKQSAYLAKQLDMNYVFGASIRYRTGAYGNALLSKFPIKSPVTHFLPDSTENRSCLKADIEIGSQILTVLNTHLGLDSQSRQRQLREFILPLMKKQLHPAILLGDFNAPDNSQEVKMVAKYLQDTFEFNSAPQVNTFSANHPQTRIDYIFFNSYCECGNFYIVDSMASDHLPVVAVISI